VLQKSVCVAMVADGIDPIEGAGMVAVSGLPARRRQNWHCMSRRNRPTF
jgi:hypothetical protein